MQSIEIVLGILLKGGPTNSDYSETIENVPELRNLASEILLTRNPTNAELLGIILKAKDQRRAAWTKLSTQNPTNQELAQVIKHADGLRGEAWDQLKQQQPTNFEIVDIINTVAALQLPAWQLLIKQSPNEAELLEAYSHHYHEREKSPLRIPMAMALIDSDCSMETLYEVIRREESLREMAVDRYLKRQPSKDQMRTVLWAVQPETREQICFTLMNDEPSLVDLHVIVDCSEALREEAAQALLAYDYLGKGDEKYALLAVLARCPTLWGEAWPRYLATRPEPLDLYNFHNHGCPTQFQEQVVREFLKVTGTEKNYGSERDYLRRQHRDIETPTASLDSPRTKRGPARKSVQ